MVDSSTINIPDLGEVEEAEVIEICVEVGQSVESEDPIMVLETDKAAMEIPASVDGIVKNIKVSVGDKAKTGMPFVDIEIIYKNIDKEIETTKPSDVLKDKLEHKEALKSETPLNNPTITPSNYLNSSIHSGPATRKLAREFGINLNEIDSEIWKVFWITQDSDSLTLHFVLKCPLGGCNN